MRPARREALVLGAVGAAAAAGGVLLGLLALQSRSPAAELLATAFPDLHGRQRRLAEWRGRILICNFWATWCAPCREEIPLLVAAQQQYAPRGLLIVGIAIDKAENVSDFAAKYRISYPLLLADAQTPELLRALGNPAAALPFTVFVDRNGEVAHRKLGALHGPEIAAVAESLLR